MARPMVMGMIGDRSEQELVCLVKSGTVPADPSEDESDDGLLPTDLYRLEYTCVDGTQGQLLVIGERDAELLAAKLIRKGLVKVIRVLPANDPRHPLPEDGTKVTGHPKPVHRQPKTAKLWRRPGRNGADRDI